MKDISLERFQEARRVIQGKALCTPLVPLQSAVMPKGHSLLLKAECLQPSGSFKVRGASYCISLLSAKQRKAGVVAYSTGNHAQAVALAAQQLGIKATIVMSPEAPEYKISATRSYGAEVVMVTPQQRRHHAEEFSRTTGAYLVPPYDHIDVITGQGTIGLEIVENLQPAAVFVPLGGGGLISGIAMAIKKSKRGIKIIGVEPELENDGWQSFKTGKLVTMAKPSHSIADAVRLPSLGHITFPLIQTYVDDIITVSEKQIAAATILSTTAHLIVEPAGALALAGALHYTGTLPRGKPVVCVASGGNTTLETLVKLQK